MSASMPQKAASSVPRAGTHHVRRGGWLALGLTVLAMTGMHFLEKRAGRGFKRSAS